MKLVSTNDKKTESTWRDAVLQGLAQDGGLFVPVSLPTLPATLLTRLGLLSFPEMAFELSRLFLEDEVPDHVLRSICEEAFSFPLELHEVEENRWILELFHGPTCAFKDFGARFMARLFRYFLGETGDHLTVLAATSGDTGSAVANAFADSSPSAPIKVRVLFPQDKVSEVQEKQMTSLGGNVLAFEVRGTFDDCQRMVKEALADRQLTARTRLTSANSINIARLLPQLFYYVFAALRIPAPAMFGVPSGNLGNLTGGLLAAAIGAPIQGFIAASNANDVFPAYLKSGTFSPRASIETLSNAMDVGNPSNFHRIISLFDGDFDLLTGRVQGFRVSDQETLETIRDMYQRTGYMLDPHAAVGYRAATQLYPKDPAPTVILATAHPAKFGPVVKEATGVDPILPPQLASCLESDGEKITIDPSYEAFARYL